MTDASLYDAQIDLSTGDGGVPRDKCKDWMRVRLFGTDKDRSVSVPPPFVGSIFFINDCGGDVSIRRGVALPITVSPGEIAHVMFPESHGDKPAGMRAVR